MGGLKKTKKVYGSSLVETITATIILMMVFAIAISSIANILERTAQNKLGILDKELNRQEYLYKNEKIQVPDVLKTKFWQLHIGREKEGELTYVVFRIKSTKSAVQKTRRILERSK